MRSDRMRLEDCPDDEQLAAFVEGTAAALPARESVEAHLAGCSTCLDVVAALLKSTVTASAREERPPAAACRGAGASWRVGLRRWAIAAALVLATGACWSARSRRGSHRAWRGSAAESSACRSVRRRSP